MSALKVICVLSGIVCVANKRMTNEHTVSLIHAGGISMGLDEQVVNAAEQQSKEACEENCITMMELNVTYLKSTPNNHIPPENLQGTKVIQKKKAKTHTIYEVHGIKDDNQVILNNGGFKTKVPLDKLWSKYQLLEPTGNMPQYDEKTKAVIERYTKGEDQADIITILEVDEEFQTKMMDLFNDYHPVRPAKSGPQRTLVLLNQERFKVVAEETLDLCSTNEATDRCATADVVPDRCADMTLKELVYAKVEDKKTGKHIVVAGHHASSEGLDSKDVVKAVNNYCYWSDACEDRTGTTFLIPTDANNDGNVPTSVDHWNFQNLIGTEVIRKSKGKSGNTLYKVHAVKDGNVILKNGPFNKKVELKSLWSEYKMYKPTGDTAVHSNDHVIFDKEEFEEHEVRRSNKADGTFDSSDQAVVVTVLKPKK